MEKIHMVDKKQINKDLSNYLKHDRDKIKLDDNTLNSILKIINDKNLFNYESVFKVANDLYSIVITNKDNQEEYDLFIKIFFDYYELSNDRNYLNQMYYLFNDKNKLAFLYNQLNKFADTPSIDSFDFRILCRYIISNRSYYVNEEEFLSVICSIINDSQFKHEDITLLIEKQKEIDKKLVGIIENQKEIDEYNLKIKELQQKYNELLDKIKEKEYNLHLLNNKEKKLNEEDLELPNYTEEELEQYSNIIINNIKENQLVEYSIKNKNVNLKLIIKEGLMYGDITPMDKNDKVDLQLEAYLDTYIGNNLNIYRSVKDYINTFYMSFDDTTMIFNNDGIKYFDEDTYISLIPFRIKMLLKFIRNNNQKILSDILKINPNFNDPYGSRCDIKKMIEIFGIDVVANPEKRFVTDISKLDSSQYEYYKELIDINSDFTFDYRELIYENKIYKAEEFAYLDSNIQKILYGLLPEHVFILDITSINEHSDKVKAIINYYTSPSTKKGKNVNINYFLIPMYEKAKEKEKFLENYSKMTREEQLDIINELENNININHDDLEKLNKNFFIKKETNKVMRKRFK